MYVGDWANDMQSGHGVEYWDYNKIMYSGDFINGRKSGKGKFEFEGSTYTGDFEDG